MRLVTLMALTACVSGLASCRSQQPVVLESYAQATELVRQYVRHYDTRPRVPWLGPPPNVAARLRRRHAGRQAVLAGSIKELPDNGREEILPGAFVAIDGKIAASVDAAGNYTIVLPPGRHHVRAGFINFLPSEAPSLQLEPGDSICLNFRLMQDLRPILCQ